MKSFLPLFAKLLGLLLFPFVLLGVLALMIWDLVRHGRLK